MPITTNLALRPELNKELCFKAVPPQSLNQAWSNYHAPQDWLDRFAELIYTTKTLNETNSQNSEQIKKDLQRHLTHYFITPEFQNTLQRIYAVMSQSVCDPSVISFDPVKDNSLLADKLYEGLRQCSQGFYIRLNEIWQGWTTETNFTKWLQVIRQEIVGRVQSELSQRYINGANSGMEVHLHNDVVKVAFNMNLGVSPPTSDPYSGGVSDEIIQTCLKKTFEQHYTPLLIIKHIEEQILSHLLLLGYTNKPKFEENGLSYGEYENWIQFFQIIFPNEDVKVESWFIIQENDKGLTFVVDINKPFIRQAILKKLSEEGFFKLKDPALQLQYIPFETTNQDELEYWAIHYVDRALLFDRLNKLQPEVKFNSLRQLHHISTKNPSLQTYLTPYIAQWVSREEDLIMSRLIELRRSKDLSFDSVNWMTAILTALNKEKMVNFIKKRDTDNKNLFQLITRFGSTRTINLFLDFLSKQLAIDKIKILFESTTQNTADTVWGSAIESSFAAAAMVTLFKFAQKLEIPIPIPLLIREFQLDDEHLIDTLKKKSPFAADLIELSILVRKQINETEAIAIVDLILTALEDCPQCLPPLLDYFETLPSKDKLTILQQNNKIVLRLAEKQPALFNTLLEKLKQQNTTRLLDNILNSKNANNETLLILVAQAGNAMAVQNLLELDVDVGGLDNLRHSALHWAAMNGHLDVVTILLKHDAPINNVGYTPLHYAIHMGHNTIVQALLDKGADICHQNQDGDNAFDMAINHERFELIKLMLLKAITLRPEEQEKISTKETQKNLLMLILEYNPELIGLITEQIAKYPEQKTKITALFTAVDKNGQTVWDYATKASPTATKTLFNCAQQLEIPIFESINAKYNLDNIERLLKTPSANSGTQMQAVMELIFLHTLARRKEQAQKHDTITLAIEETEETNKVLARIFFLASEFQPAAISSMWDAINSLAPKKDKLAIQAGFLRQVDKNKQNPLMYALTFQTAEVLPLLHLVSKLNIDSQIAIFSQPDIELQTALMLALRHTPQALESLLEIIKTLPRRVQIELFISKDIRGKNVFDLAEEFKQKQCAANQPDPMRLLFTHIETLASKANIAPIYDILNSRLILAAQAGNAVAVQNLLELGVDVGASDSSGRSALHWAAVNGHLDVVTILLKHNAPIKNKGYTPLHYAIHMGHNTIVQALLDKDADICYKNQNGYNAFDMAINHRRFELIKPILLKAITLHPEEQEKISTKETQKNLLMLILEYNPELISLITEQIAKYPEQKTKINALFTAVDKSGQTVWDYATKASPTATKTLFNCAQQLEIPIFESINAKYNLDDIERLLRIPSANSGTQMQAVMELIFLHTLARRKEQAQKHDTINLAIEETNAVLARVFILASKFQPAAINSMWKAINSLAPEKDKLAIQAGFLKQVDKNKQNPLMYALTFQTAEVLPFCHLVSTLDMESRIAIFLQPDINLQTALMLALRHTPQALESLLEVIKTLPLSAQIELFISKDLRGKNVFDLAAEFKQKQCAANQPDPTQLLLTHIETLASKTNITPILQTIKLDQLKNAEQLLIVLKLRRATQNSGITYSPLTKSELKTLEAKISPQDWYQIINDELLPIKIIKSHKEKVYQHITNFIDEGQRKTTLKNSVDSTTSLGKFFWAKRGFFKPTINSGTLRKLQDQLSLLEKIRDSAP